MTDSELLELAASLIQPLTGKGDREVYDALRAALAAQPAEPAMDTVLRNAARRSATVIHPGRLAAQPAEVPRCKYCDGTGDVHGIDGEWRGRCTECNFAAQEPRTREEKEQYAFEDWFASECPSGSVEAVQRQWEESAEYLELQDDTPAQPAPAAVPPGYALVPIEPTPEMCKIGGHVMSEWTDDSAPLRERTYAVAFADAYRAIIAAAAGDKP